MENGIKFDRESLNKRIDDLALVIGPFVRSLNIADGIIHGDNKVDCSIASKALEDVINLEEFAKNDTLVSIDSMIKEISELQTMVKSEIDNHERMSDEWRNKKHDSDSITSMLFRLNASRNIIINGIDKIEFLKDEIRSLR